MVKRSWFFQNGLFYTILALVLLIHLVLLAVRMYKNQDVVRSVPDRSVTGPPIKVKIVRDPDKRVTIRQIVQSEDPDTKLKPTDPAFLSDKDRQFSRQSVAKKVDTFKEAGKGNSSRNDISLSDLSTFDKSHHPFKAGAGAYAQAKRNRMIAGTENGNPDNQGVSSTSDHVDKVPLGDITHLNTKEFKYYGFYHRIGQKIEQFWGRSIQEVAEDLMNEGRYIASEMNITSLIVTMDHKGNIKNITVRASSGVKELDEAAINSFNMAGPFPHPPKGLIENGIVRFEFGFNVQTSG